MLNWCVIDALFTVSGIGGMREYKSLNLLLLV